MGEYETISVKKGVKASIEDEKGDREWGEYIVYLYNEAKEAKRMKAAQRLRELLTDSDLEKMREASREFREKFELK
jgi:hypothetical protein